MRPTRLIMRACREEIIVPKVLVASDGSNVAISAARRGVSLLAPGSEITVIAVAPLISPVTGMPQAGAYPGPLVDPLAIDEVAAARGQSASDDVDATVAALGVDAARRVEHGDPAETICEVARTGGFDVIVVGSHGAGFLKRTLLGSVSQDVLRHAPCPVLVVRHVEA